VALHDFLDDRSEVAVLPLEVALIFYQKLVEVMEQHPIENGSLRMTGTVNASHNRR
jgi:hypothetical protein